jgi:hypothetical protein
MTDVYAPLYEAKMLSFFDHRAADSVRGAGNQRQTVPAYLSDTERDDPRREVVSLYWVSELEVEQAIPGAATGDWLLGWADITSATNLRSFIPCAIPRSAVGNKFPLALLADAKCAPEFLGVCSSLVFDYLVRQKLSGITLNYFIVKQFPIPTPAQLSVAAPWLSSASISSEIRDRGRELTFTSWRMAPFGRDMGDFGPPFRWLPPRREQIRAELDAMMFHVYGLDREEVDYVLDTFTVMRKYDERDHGEYRTKRLILEYYDLLASSIASGVGYVTPISPVPGDGPRHDESTRPEWMPGVE